MANRLDLDEQGGALIVARLDRIPVWPYPRRLLWLLGMAYLFAFMDIVTFGITMPTLVTVLHSSLSVLSIALTINLLGYIVGAYVLSAYADLRGRKPALVLTTLLVSIGSLLTVFTTNVAWLAACRFLTGVGIGAEISLAATYLGEIAPANVRGRINALANVYAVAGIAVIPFLGVLLLPLGDIGWRLIYLVGALGGVFVWSMRAILPESPRWLATKGRLDEADAVVAEAEAAVTARGWSLPEPTVEGSERPARGFPTQYLLRPPYLGRLIFLSLGWLLIYLGDYAWLGLGPSLLVAHGYSLSSTLDFLLISSVGDMVGILVTAYYLVAHYEKKHISVAGIILRGAGVLAIALARNPLEISVAVFILSAAMMTQPGVLYLYTAEHFPTRARTNGVALTDGIGHIGGALAPYLVLPFVPVVIGGVHQGGFGVMACAYAAAALTMGLCGLRTGNRQLEVLAD